MKPFLLFLICLSFTLSACPVSLSASSGSEGAAFLDIPVGARPASMGAAYSALADDAYAPTLNPGGLGFLNGTQFAGQHLSYVDSLHYEYLSYAVPLPAAGCPSGDGCRRSALGGSIQYLGSGDIAATNNAGDSAGDFSSHYGAYSLSYGRALTDRLSTGVTGKWINAKIADVSANAFAADFGGMYRATHALTLAAMLTNVGTKLKFLDQSDSLPLAFRVGAAYEPWEQWKTSIEAVYRQAGPASGHLGIEWSPIPMVALRTGYRTDTVRELGALAGFTTGLGFNAFGQEFSYAWVPMGDLGDTHYFSLVLHIGEAAEHKRDLIRLRTIKGQRTVRRLQDAEEPEYRALIELLSEDREAFAKK